MKIVVLDGYAMNPGDLSWHGMEKLGQITVYDRTPKELVVERIGDAEIVLTNKVILSREVLEKTPAVKYIGVMATGYNVVDTGAARELGITVTNVPAYSTDSVAQLVFAFILEFCHHVGEHNRAVQEGAWTNSRDFAFWNFPLIELAHKTLGLIGFGAIGQTVARLAVAFGMNVKVYSRTVKKELETGNIKFASLDEVLTESDFISLHCPLTEETKELINKDTLSGIKSGAFLINTSRGPVISEKDVADALNSGRLAGAAVDVVSAEPISGDNPLLGAKNCIITPHFGWAPFEARTRLMDTLIKNVSAYMDGKPVNVVN
ncbi:MAG: D-isomer specific 2-hydroxyacid dehydrogenase NAD-binding [Eubacterium sp.]|nr:D-isomer specific 2-hydroxyacid dehydrogenase NAD-binding [Eubacterium sp.]